MNSPKEKADELVDKFMDEFCGLNELHGYHEAAKQCAIIAVEEILNLKILHRPQFPDMATQKYWSDVKNEIERL